MPDLIVLGGSADDHVAVKVTASRDMSQESEAEPMAASRCPGEAMKVLLNVAGQLC